MALPETNQFAASSPGFLCFLDLGYAAQQEQGDFVNWNSSRLGKLQRETTRVRTSRQRKAGP
jgi:hypothetical protein